MTMPTQIRRFVRIILVIVTFIFIFLIYHHKKSALVVSTLASNNHSRGVIVTLIRTTNRSILLTINMIHSVVQFHSANNSHRYPFLIFHDQNFTSAMRQYILSCVLKTNKQLQISFALVNFHTDIEPDIRSREDKPIEYRLMCRFWSYDVFYHPEVIQGHYDYLMRMDDDSYFSDVIQKDLFQYMNTRKLDYIYRSWYSENTDAMFPIEKLYLNIKSSRVDCIYNNFFMIRLRWFYESKRVQTFLRELMQDNLILREYIGDGCVHAAMLEIDNQARVEHITDISYGHNIHWARTGYKYNALLVLNGFSEEILNSCHQLTFINGSNRRLGRIKM